MKTIEATLGFSALVDDEDYERLSQYRWYAHNCGGKRFTPSKRPARRTTAAEGRKVLFLVHHIIRPEKGLVVDHINGDPWDNRRANLRVCTNSENLKNRAKHGGNTSNPFKGVFPNSSNKRFRAIIGCEGTIYPLGWYDSADEAAVVYDSAALALHGEFARLNFPDRGTKPCHPNDLSWSFADRTNPARAEAVRLLRAGGRALPIAKALGLSTATVCRWAAHDGISLSRGRPSHDRDTRSNPTSPCNTRASGVGA